MDTELKIIGKRARAKMHGQGHRSCSIPQTFPCRHLFWCAGALTHHHARILRSILPGSFAPRVKAVLTAKDVREPKPLAAGAGPTRAGDR